jgi:hypothetical protein
MAFTYDIYGHYLRQFPSADVVHVSYDRYIFHVPMFDFLEYDYSLCTHYCYNKISNVVRVILLFETTFYWVFKGYPPVVPIVSPSCQCRVTVVSQLCPLCPWMSPESPDEGPWRVSQSTFKNWIHKGLTFAFIFVIMATYSAHAGTGTVD